MRQHADDDDHDRRGIPVRLGVGVLAGLVGSSNNPVSGITIATILFASLDARRCCSARDSPIGPVAAIMIGAVVCCAAAVGGDNLQDLKAGYIVGATPWKQQLMLVIGAVLVRAGDGAGAESAAQAYGIGPPTPGASATRCAAPQATLMASVAQGHVRRPAAVGHDRHRRGASARSSIALDEC